MKTLLLSRDAHNDPPRPLTQDLEPDACHSKVRTTLFESLSVCRPGDFPRSRRCVPKAGLLQESRNLRSGRGKLWLQQLLVDRQLRGSPRGCSPARGGCGSLPDASCCTSRSGCRGAQLRLRRRRTDRQARARGGSSSRPGRDDRASFHRPCVMYSTPGLKQKQIYPGASRSHPSAHDLHRCPDAARSDTRPGDFFSTDLRWGDMGLHEGLLRITRITRIMPPKSQIRDAIDLIRVAVSLGSLN